ncbi:MAG: PAS domain-containing protein [Rhodoferax sp.]|nr:PAS domain-containing protein [Rhodoferax sp.]
MSTFGEWSLETLRGRAEARAKASADPALADTKNLSLETLRTLVHELQVHQIELEMQNDELRTTQAKLDAARSRYFDLYDLAPVGYCTVNAQGLILETNFTAATLMDTVRSNLVNQPVSRFIVKADQDSYYRCRKVLFDGGSPQECELQMVKRSGGQFWVHLRMSVVEDATGATVQRIVINDISERKRLDDMLKTQNQELQVARALADKASQAKSDFLSNMTHELRSPLNAILGFAQLMEMGSPPPSPSQQSSIRQILRAGWYLLDLVGEILDFTAIEAGTLALSLHPMPLDEVLLDCQAMMEPQAQKRNISMHFSPLAQPLWVLADQMRLKQVIVNLLSNAIKYNRIGGSLDVGLSRQADKRLRISVRDTGEGLSADKLAQLFQPFNRLGRESATEEGTGIGLAVSKRLVELMGGSIGADSTVGTGSVFWIDLDLVEPP